tara:strand:- start:3187 stop:3528 length:342 start_codon:yes stop_codon:yes gene_type:complete
VVKGIYIIIINLIIFVLVQYAIQRIFNMIKIHVVFMKKLEYVKTIIVHLVRHLKIFLKDPYHVIVNPGMMKVIVVMRNNAVIIKKSVMIIVIFAILNTRLIKKGTIDLEMMRL